MKIFLSFVLIVTYLLAAPKPMEKVSLQLLWLHQFQFAGYYMAKEKGFYSSVGLDVSLKEYRYGINITEDVISLNSTFGVGRADLIRHDSDGKKILLLASMYQSSPNVLIALKSSNIKTVKDFKSKTMMQTNDLVQSASINAMLKVNGLSLADMNIVEHSTNLEDLINGDVDIYSGYISNEPYSLKEKGLEYKLFSSAAEGFDLYSDILFTSQKYFKTHESSVRNFRDASLKGWEYAFSHIKESVDVIYKKYNTQHKTKKALLFEAKELKKLAYKDTKKIGKIDKEKVQRIYDIYKILGIAPYQLNIKNLLYNPKRVYLSEEEKEYLEQRGAITFCTQPKALPYSAIKDGKFVGIGAGVLDIIKHHVDMEFKLVSTQTWQESLMKIATRECDMLPIASKTSSRNRYIDFTHSYYKEPLVIVTKQNEKFIIDAASVLDKKFSVVKGNAHIENLKLKYPNIDLVPVDSTEDGFAGVESGKYFGHIDVLISAAYIMQHKSKLNLKIAGQFNDRVEVSLGVRNDDPLLFSILDKVSQKIREEELQKVFNKWISINYNNNFDIWYYKEYFMPVFIFILFLIYRDYLLKKKNKELEDLQNQLRELNTNLENRIEIAVDDIKKKDAYLLHQSRLAQMGEMLSMIAHQWKQPLALISTTEITLKTTLELEKYDFDDKKQRDEFLVFLNAKLDKISGYVQNLAKIINDFSNFYKPNKVAQIYEVNELIQKAYNLVEDLYGAHDIVVKFDLQSKKFIEVHENEFIQVILNILNNAREQLKSKNSIKNQTISVKTYDNDNYVYIEIWDNAGGVPVEIMDNVFDPYFSTKLDKNGTGLGLYMSKMIINGYRNGDIEVKNENNGALFTIKMEAE